MFFPLGERKESTCHLSPRLAEGGGVTAERFHRGGGKTVPFFSRITSGKRIRVRLRVTGRGCRSGAAGGRGSLSERNPHVREKSDYFFRGGSQVWVSLSPRGGKGIGLNFAEDPWEECPAFFP